MPNAIRKWNISPFAAFCLCFALTLFLRIPYFFISTQIYSLDALTYHDEALFMLQGKDVLEGYLPYLRHWDNRPPLGWYTYALFDFLSDYDLTLFRFWGALYIAFTAYAIYLTGLKIQHKNGALLAAIFYIIFASSIQISQSFTYEHMAALPLTAMLYCLFHPAPAKRHHAGVVVFFSICCLLLTNFIILLPAIAFIWHRPMLHLQHFKSRDWKNISKIIQPFLLSGVLLLLGVTLGFGIFFCIYAWHGYAELLFNSVFVAPVSLKPQVDVFPPYPYDPLGNFYRFMLVYYATSHLWLIGLLTSLFVLRLGFKKSFLFNTPERQLDLLLLLLFGLAALLVRSFIFVDPYRLLQILPIICLMMGETGRWLLKQKSWLALPLIIGIICATKPIFYQYSLLSSDITKKTEHGAFYNDELYQIARIINQYPGESLYACHEGAMLNILTGTQNPAYLIFPAFNYYPSLHKALKMPFRKPLVTVAEAEPSFIVTVDNNKCVSLLSRALFHYKKIGRIGDMPIYWRSD